LAMTLLLRISTF